MADNPGIALISSTTNRAAGAFCFPDSGKISRSSKLDVRDSAESEGARWDAFLRSIPQGQFQQSSAWARFKKTQGWNISRRVLTVEGAIVGGFQILWRSTRLGRIGYVSKGPILLEETPRALALVGREMVKHSAELRLQAIIAQPPDSSRELASALSGAGFHKARCFGIIEATCLLDLAPDTASLENRMSSSARRNLRHARAAGVVVREGSGNEIPLFFDLMAATCGRRGVRPNPPNVAAMEALWRFMSENDGARLTFALCQGEIVAGKLLILFGNRSSSFKVGWNGRHGRSYPNELLELEALQWAQSKGFRLADWVGISRQAALTAPGGGDSGEAGIRSSDRFILRFGGCPLVLPPPLIWIRNPVARYCYRFAEPVLLAMKSHRKHAATRSNN